MVNAVLPFLNNWMLTDTFSPKVFFNRAELIEEIKLWLDSSLPFTVRFGIVTLMRHFLDKQYFPEVLSLVANIKSDEYYVNMAQAWFFATSLCKQYDDSIAYIEERRLSDFTHNKTIQKSCESLRVSGEHKEYLRSLIIRNI